MQPLFPQRQWEETVDKMVKVYGAQMDQGQRQSIVGYLVTIHGPNSTPERSLAHDDDFDFAPAAKPGPPPETAPLLKFADQGAEPCEPSESWRGTIQTELRRLPWN